MYISTLAKKCLLAGLFLAAATFSANAQNYSFIDGKAAKTTANSSDNETEVTVHLKVRNNTAQDIELTWQMLDNEFTSNNWQYVSFCDPYICHNDIPNTFSPPLVANKTSDSVSEFKLAATPKITARTSKMRIIVWQTGQSQVDTLTFEIDALPMSIADEKAAVNTFAAYPNPAKNTLTLGFDPKSNYTVTVYSMNGAAMMSSKLTANQKTLNVETLPAGLYFINATDEKGNLSVSKFSKL